MSVSPEVLVLEWVDGLQVGGVCLCFQVKLIVEWSVSRVFWDV